MTRVCAFFLFLVLAASQAQADFCMLSQNGLHLGWGAEDAARQAKRDALRAIFKDYDVVLLQEVMRPDEVPRLAPPGFTATVSTARGRGSYREHYAVLTRISAMRVLAVADYPDSGGVFARPPFGAALEDKDGGRYWLVDVHIDFSGGMAARRAEVAAMAAVTEFFATRPMPDGAAIARVVVAGDWNLPAADRAFAALPGGFTVAPDLPSSLNAEGAYRSAYDHYLWSAGRLAIAFADDPRDGGGLSGRRYRQRVSDHVGVAGYVMADPNGRRPEGIACPPARPQELSASTTPAR